MLCDICHKAEATVHYTEIVHNQMIKMDLCEACAMAKGVGVQSPFSISDLLSGLTEIDDNNHTYEDVACPCCGLRFSEFRKSGRLGCGDCYMAFAEQLQSLLKTIHKNTQHKGKRYRSKESGAEESVSLKETVKKLKEELNKAIAEEAYELAAELRDQVKEIERQIKDGSAAS
ncbi:MAG: UvrB/UvrC motif-containing protein [Candidatus Auribacterota bacterium]|jgi:protein arginine kinase activator|nr:UvrB/UvrC motif-containing protein [Candidatus Auribacterota bacterium]